MEQVLYRYNPWWEGEFKTETLIDRPRLTENLIKQLPVKDIVFLTGLRRIGKTTALKLLINYLINKKNISSEKIFYISLDDYLLSKHSIIEIVDAYRKIHKLSFNQKIYLFFDEITYQKDFEQQLKNLYDTHNVKIYTSTSQSASLKIKKAFITGRSKIIELLPLDFDEYLAFKNIKINRKDTHLYEKHFEEFLQTGGIPEYVLRGDIEYLKELVDDIILKDIAAVNNIRDIPLLKDFYLMLMERSGKIFSINKIANILSSSPDTIRRYLNYFNETYLIYLMPRYGKTNERILSPKKIYAPDLGIRNLFTGFRDKGSLFENYIYLKLKHRKPSYIYKDGIEIDFITEDKILVEVKYGSELNKKQKVLFDSIKAEEKHIVTGFNDLTKSAVFNK